MIEVSSPKFLFNYTQIILFLKSHYCGKCSHLMFLYIMGYNISRRPFDPHDPLHPEIWGGETPNPPGLTPMAVKSNCV